jgi:creatinine amidohydrolase
VKIAEMSWGQVEAYLRDDDRCAVPLGSVEQHANLSLAVDAILSERVAAEAAAPLGVPVFPAVAYGITPYFLAYPGSVSLRVSTYVALVRDILDSLRGGGFRRVLLVNGHGGNQPAGSLAIEYMADHPEMQVRFHNWWSAPRTLAKVQEIDPVASHASWMENFPWTRLAGVVQPSQRKPMIDLERMRLRGPRKVREYLGDGNFGGYYERPDEDMLAVWDVAVEETRALIEGPWA